MTVTARGNFYFTFKDRISRSEFWFNFIFLEMMIGLLGELLTDSIIHGTVVLALNYMLFCLCIKRCHDTGRSGWYTLVPVYNLIVWSRESVAAENKYGSIPPPIGGGPFIGMIVFVILTIGMVINKGSSADAPPPKPAQVAVELPQNKKFEIVKPSHTAAISLPNLAGTPFEALSKAEAWIIDFELNVAQSMTITASSIKAGENPDKALTELETRLTHNKQIITSTNGLTVLLREQEKKMTDQIKEVEVMTTKQSLDAPLKQQYADILSTAQKSLESYRMCRANVEILGKRIEATLVSAGQWKQFYTSTAGITGNETARNRLSDMIEKVGGEWSKSDIRVSWEK